VKSGTQTGAGMTSLGFCLFIVVGVNFFKFSINNRFIAIIRRR
jgi:hypothetical protein